MNLRISPRGWALALGLSALLTAAGMVYASSRRPLTPLENTLFQFWILAAGIAGSYIFGRQSARAAADEMVKPAARSAFRRVLGLYGSLSRLANRLREFGASPKDLSVKILGLKAEAKSHLSEIRDKYGEGLIGAWENNQVGFASTFVLHETGGAPALEQIFPDGSARTITLREESAPDGRQFRDPGNRVGEYWLVRNGNLESRDSEDLVFLARPISH